jgi:hypothetical protein
VYGLKHQMEKRSMDHFAGLDVSVKQTSVCIVDDAGRIVREVKVASEPEALLQVLTSPSYSFKRIGLEAGPLSQWLYSALAEADIHVSARPCCVQELPTAKKVKEVTPEKTKQPVFVLRRLNRKKFGLHPRR